MRRLRLLCALVVVALGAFGLTAAQASAPPSVASTTPAAGATGVAVDASYSAVFSGAMDAATITASSFTLTAHGAATPVSASVAYDAATTTATLMPDAPLA